MNVKCEINKKGEPKTKMLTLPFTTKMLTVTKMV